jgi:hypothetical protein
MSTTYQINLNYDQIKQIIDQLDVKEKLAIYLDDEILQKQIKEFQNEMKKTPITFDDITKEVEFVRKQRYENRINI